MADQMLIVLGVLAGAVELFASGRLRPDVVAMKSDATVEEIMEVMKLCVVQGVQACNLGVPILAEELATRPNDLKFESDRGGAYNAQ